MIIYAPQKVADDVSDMLLKISAVNFRLYPPYVFTSGIKSPIYIDNRLIMSYPEIRKKIVDYYVEMIKEHIGLKNIDYISATATAAIPQGAWIAEKLNLPMVFVRSSAKTHGKENKVDGYLKKGSKVVIVEDHLSAGVSSVGNAEAIRELGGEVQYIVAATSYDTEEAKKLLEEHKLNAVVLTPLKSTVKKAFKIVEEWFKSPVAWGDKYGM